MSSQPTLTQVQTPCTSSSTNTLDLEYYHCLVSLDSIHTTKLERQHHAKHSSLNTHNINTEMCIPFLANVQRAEKLKIMNKFHDLDQILILTSNTSPVVKLTYFKIGLNMCCNLLIRLKYFSQFLIYSLCLP